MATHLETVNRVMRRLREDTVSSTTDNDYSELISEFVRDAVEVCEEAHDWEAFKHLIRVDMEADTAKYDLTRTVSLGGNVRNGDTSLDTESELQWISSNVPDVAVFDSDSDEQSNYKPTYLSPGEFRDMKRRDRTETNSELMYFTIYNENAGTAIRKYVEVYPTPSASRVFEAMFWTPPTDLELDGTTDSQEILLPNRPVFLYALFFALNERGEEIGEPGNIAQAKADDSLGLAIEKDINAAQRSSRYDWRRD